MAEMRTTILSTTADVPGAPADLRRDVLNGCPWHDVKSKLREVGLRPTRQRMALGWILFAKGDCHLTAEMLYEESTKVGLLRQVAVDGSKTYFDTNVSEHHHFFIEGENALVDIPDAAAIVGKMPVAPAGFE